MIVISSGYNPPEPRGKLSDEKRHSASSELNVLNLILTGSDSRMSSASKRVSRKWVPSSRLRPIRGPPRSPFFVLGSEQGLSRLPPRALLEAPE